LASWPPAKGFASDTLTTVLGTAKLAGSQPDGVEWVGMLMGLGFVLGFGYWCTDFLVVQRAMAAESMSAARRTPLIAAIPRCSSPRW